VPDKPSGKTSPKALIIGVSGQTGSYLAESLFHRGFTVIGTSFTRTIPNEVLPYLKTTYPLNINVESNIRDLLAIESPDYIYNFTGLSSVLACQNNPADSYTINYRGVLNILNAIVACKELTQINPKFVQASSSEMFSGESAIKGIDEESALNPGSIYGEHKAKAHEAVLQFSDKANISVLSAILFNHESHRRQPNFLSRKVTLGIKDILEGKQENLALGNLDVGRDWGYAPDYAEAIALTSMKKNVNKIVVASGQLKSVKEFVDSAFRVAGLNYRDYVRVDNSFVRKRENPGIYGNNEKLVKGFNWKPSVDFEGLVGKLVHAELNHA